MNIWNKVFLVLLFLTAAFYTVLMANRYKLTRQWEEKIVKLDKEIVDLQTTVAKLRVEIDGDPYQTVTTWDDMGLRVKMDHLTELMNGRVWVNCFAPRAPARNGQKVNLSFCIASTDRPRIFSDLHLAENTAIFIFDSGQVRPAEGEGAPAASGEEGAAPEASRFLGVFHVDSVNAEANEINISSVGVFGDDDFDRLDDSVTQNHSWIVYSDRLPIDSPDDIAFWLADPENAVGKTLSAEAKVHFAKKALTPEEMLAAPAENTVEEFTLDEPAADENTAEADELAADGPAVDENTAETDELAADGEQVSGEPISTADIPSDKRFPVNYELALWRRFTKRDVLTLLIMKRESVLADLRKIICDQLVAIGLPEIPEETLAQLGPTPEEAQAVAKEYIQQKAARQIEDKIAQKKRLVEYVEKMSFQRDFVRKRLDVVTDVVERLQKRIDQLLKENCDLALKIAQAQFEAAEKAIQKSENVAVQVKGDSASISAPKSDI